MAEKIEQIMVNDREEAGAGATGWKRGVYPTEATPRAAQSRSGPYRSAP